ncbi:MAG: hypothetical protein A2167_03320 [Planctomycetes bacterium RBG_13_46_10]|nr:MAG: hypothetical protein A2167_03320 [Planctomycetes bacterium RBG_13_46_10]
MANIAVLRKYLGNSVVKSFWQKATAESTTAETKCPSCRHSLRSFEIHKDEQTITLDICRRCHLLWFDKGELDAFPKVKTEELSPQTRQELALLKIEYDKQLQEELTHSAMAFNNITDIITSIIRLIVTFP